MTNDEKRRAEEKRREIDRIRQAHYRRARGWGEPRSAEPAPREVERPVPQEPVDVAIPDGYQSLPWSRPSEPGGLTLRGLVKSLGGVAANKDEAIAFIAAKERQQ